MEKEAEKIFAEVEAFGGVLAGIEKGYFQREIAKSAYRYQLQVEKKERIVVGVNEYIMDDKIEIPLLEIDESVEREQCESLRQLRQARDNSKVDSTLAELKKACEDD